MRRFTTWKSSLPQGIRPSALCWYRDKFKTIECLYALSIKCKIAGMSCSAPGGGELSRLVARVTRVANVSSTMPFKTSLFWRNLSTGPESATEKTTRKRDRGVPKCADHLEDDDGARADLANVATGEERLGPTK